MVSFLSSPQEPTNSLQVVRRNHPRNLQRRQHHPNIHPPSHSTLRPLTHNPNTLHIPNISNLNKLLRTLPSLLPPRHIHNPLPLNPHRSSNTPPKLPLTLHHSTKYLQSHLANNRSIPHTLLSPLVRFRDSLPYRHRLPNSSIRRITQRRRPYNSNADHTFKTPQNERRRRRHARHRILSLASTLFR